MEATGGCQERLRVDDRLQGVRGSVGGREIRISA